jgi:hypothetical protein
VASTALQKVERPKGEEVSSELSFSAIQSWASGCARINLSLNQRPRLNSLPKEADDAMETAERDSDTARDPCVS